MVGYLVMSLGKQLVMKWVEQLAAEKDKWTVHQWDVHSVGRMALKLAYELVAKREHRWVLIWVNMMAEM